MVFKELFEESEAACESLVGIFYPLPVSVGICIMCFVFFFEPSTLIAETSPTASQMFSGCLTKETQVPFVSQGCFYSSTTGRNYPVALKLSKTRGLSDGVDSARQQSSDSLARPTQ